MLPLASAVRKSETAPMRKLPFLLALGWAVAAGSGSVMAQVELELLVPQDQFLRDEPVPIKVRITNRSGQTLRLGEGNDWLTFNVEVPGRGPVERVGAPPLASPFELESAHQATREVDLQPWFDLGQPGRYSVSVTLRVRQWDREMMAKPRPFEIVRGAKLWEQEIGVPGAGQPEVRKFILQQANYRKQMKLYLRISNESDTHAYAVMPLGPVVSFGRPEAQVDELSNLHVLFQTGARSFFYEVVSPTGVLSTRQSYDYGPVRPTLRLNDAGRITVAGGIRRMAATDLPVIASTPPADKDVAPPAK